MGKRVEWFEDESFWHTTFPTMFDPARIGAGKEDARKVRELTGVRRGKVLDLCCGPGRHSVAFAKLGYRVTAVDRTPFLLAKARAAARRSRARIAFVRSDMREFVRDGEFDLALSLFTSFGYFRTEEEDLRVLLNLHRSLKPGGKLVMELMGKEVLARIFMPTTSTLSPNGTRIIQVHEVSDDWTRVQNCWIVQKGGTAKEYHFSHSVYSARELQDRLLKAGFVSTQVYGGLDGSPYDRKAQRLTVVATKGKRPAL